MATLLEEDPLLAQHPALRAVLDNHGLLTEDGELRTTVVAFQSQGVGPIIDPEVIEKFLELDTTRTLKYVDWMLLMAGGGPEALERTKEQYEQARDIWVRERMEGRGDNGEEITPLSQEQAEAAWQAEGEPAFRAAFFPGDEDVLEHFDYKVFGYGRYWPGPHNRYADVYNGVKTFLENMVGRVGNQSKVSLINQARQRRAEEGGGGYVPILTDLLQYQSLDDLKLVNDEFFYFFKRQTALKDIQYIGKGPAGYMKTPTAKFYEDQNCVAFIPATAAAMMKVGFDNWCVANRTTFDRAFHHDPRERKPPHWTSYQQQGPMCVINFKVDVTEPTRPHGTEHFKSLERLAIYLKTDLCDLPNLREPYPGLQFYDRENRYTPVPVDWPELEGRLDQLENKTVKQSVKNVVDAFIAWANQAERTDIKASVYEMLAMQLVWRMLHS